MATQSFFEDMVIENAEQIANLEEAFRIADARGPMKPLPGAHKPNDDPDLIRRMVKGFE